MNKKMKWTKTTIFATFALVATMLGATISGYTNLDQANASQSSSTLVVSQNQSSEGSENHQGGEAGEGSESGGEGGNEAAGEQHGAEAGGEQHGAGGEGAEGGSAGGREEGSGANALALNETFDTVRAGARLIMNYDAASNAFVGTVENTTSATLNRVRIEVHLSNGVELGPTTPIDLAAGEVMDVVLPATAQAFDGWTPHAEVGASEGGNG